MGILENFIAFLDDLGDRDGVRDHSKPEFFVLIPTKIQLAGLH